MSDESSDIGADDHDAAHRCACQRQFARLVPYLRQLARKLALRRGHRDPEVIEAAFAKAYAELMADRFAPEKGRLAAWASKVVEHFLIDEFRRRQRETNKLRRLAEREAQQSSTRSDDRVAPLFERFADVGFSRQDLAEIRDWPLQRRVEMLALLGLHSQVPQDAWNQWIRELNYPSPFPTDAMRAAVDRHQRTAEFAAAVGQSKNSLIQNFKRWRILFLRLGCFWRAAAELVAPWPAERIAQIAQWTPEQRVVLLALTGCWLRLGGIAAWLDWRETMNIRRELELFVIGGKSSWEQRLHCLRRDLQKKQCGRPKLDPAPTWRDAIALRTKLKPFPFPCREDDSRDARSEGALP